MTPRVHFATTGGIKEPNQQSPVPIMMPTPISPKMGLFELTPTQKTMRPNTNPMMARISMVCSL